MSTASRADRQAVLVVEDEPVLRGSMVRGLSKLAGVDILGTGTVREARRTISESPPDLVITDLDLPDGSGIEVLGELDRLGLRVPVVVVSAFIGQYRSRLPKRPGTDVFEKPVSLDRLRRLVDERLRGRTDVASSPFGVTDYIQLAGMGRRSVVIDVRGSTNRGEILIRAGEVWSAHDEHGEGHDAFRRLAFLRNALVTCRPLGQMESIARTIHGSCESVLLESARCFDESEGTIDDAQWDESPTEPSATRSSTLPVAAHEPLANLRAFQERYEDGVDALLGKRFADAYRAFLDAEEISPGDSRVHANLERLRQMGHAS